MTDLAESVPEVIDGHNKFAVLLDLNAIVDQLNSFASEVTRMACEVGVEGRLCGEAQF